MKKILLAAFLLSCTCLTQGQLFAVEFEVYQSSYKPLNLVVLANAKVDDVNEKSLLRAMVEKDLDASRSFKTLDPLSHLVTEAEAFDDLSYSDWRIIGTDLLVMLGLEKMEGGWRVDMQLHDPFRNRLLVKESLTEQSARGIQHLAHRVADFIYHHQTGLPGYFNSKIAFVKKHGYFADLMLMDADGANLQTIGKDFTLLLSPDISPDRTQVALNTYVGNRPRLEFFDLQTGQRTTFGGFKGLNSTPEFSPDGRYVAATLSHTGNSEIHLYDLKSKKWRQFTNNPAIDTTPTWSPDSKWIAYTGNRNGTPQIYRQSLANNQVIRVSLDAPYNTSPVWAPIGDRIAFVTKKEWEYAIATVHIDGTGLRYLATGERIESPAWSPNGQMILYSAEDKGRKHIYSVPIWGGEAKMVSPVGMDASDPAWSR